MLEVDFVPLIDGFYCRLHIKTEHSYVESTSIINAVRVYTCV